MKVNLVTGLDGSGKSTVLKKLELGTKKGIHIVYIPKIDSSLYEKDKKLTKTALCINEIGKLADEKQLPSFKIIAIFSAMALFDKLVHHLYNQNEKELFCERHPLIDTAVFAQVYYQVMNPALLDLSIAKKIDAKYETELAYIISLIKVEVKRTDKGISYDLLHFLFEWFSDKNHFTIASLSNIFDSKLPSKIIYLHASPKILIKRIAQRKNSEFHETESLLEKMDHLYQKVLKEYNAEHKAIKTDNWEGLDNLTLELIDFYT